MEADTLAPEAPTETAPEVASEVVDRVQLVNGHALVEFTRTERALADLRQRYEGAVFDLTTTKGDAAARTARKELVGLRSALESRRKEFKAPVLAMGAVIDQKAKAITTAILALETPIDQQIKADEARREEERRLKAEAEARRVAMLRQRIDYMRSVAVRAVGKPSSEVQAKIDLLDKTVIGEDFAEFREEAAAVHAEVLAQLCDMLATVQAQEAEAKRLAEEREADARRQRYEAKLLELRGLSIGMAGKTAAELAEAAATVCDLDMSLDAWGDADMQLRARAAHTVVLWELKNMLTAAQERERIAAEQAAEARRLDTQRQLQIITHLEQRCRDLPSHEVESVLSGMELHASSIPDGEDQAVTDARWAAIMNLRALLAMARAKEADAAAAQAAIEQAPAPVAQSSASQEPPAPPAATENVTADPAPEEPMFTIGDLIAWAGGIKLDRAFVERMGVTPKVDGRSIMVTRTQRAALKAAMVAHFQGLPT